MTISLKITKSCGYVVEHGLDDFRFAVKRMAAVLSTTSMKATGRFPMRRTTEAVREGTVGLYELSKWYPRAVAMVRTKEANQTT